MRRALAALPRDPNEPPRKRGRPRKERRLAADEQQPSPCSTKSSMSANKDINIQELHLWQNRGRSRSSSTEEKERASNSGAVRTSHSPTPTSSPRSSSEYAQVWHSTLAIVCSASKALVLRECCSAFQACPELLFTCLCHLSSAVSCALL